MPEIIPFALAREELVYAMRALDITTLPGLENPPLASLTPTEDAAMMAMADRTLRAHDLVTWQSASGRLLAPWVAAILQQCAKPRLCMTMELNQPTLPTFAALFAFAANSVIMHWQPEPGIHRFLFLPTMDAWMFYLRETLQLDPLATGPHTKIRLKRDVINAAMQTDIDSVRHLMIKQMDVKIATALAAAVMRPLRRVDIVVYPGDPATTAVRTSVTLFQGKASLWQSQRRDATDNWLEFSDITAEEAYTVLRQAVA